MASTSPLFLMWIKTNRCLVRMADPTTVKRKKWPAHPNIQNLVLLLSAQMHNLEVFCVSYSRFPGLVCIALLWRVLAILTYVLPCTAWRLLHKMSPYWITKKVLHEVRANYNPTMRCTCSTVVLLKRKSGYCVSLTIDYTNRWQILDVDADSFQISF